MPKTEVRECEYCYNVKECTYTEDPFNCEINDNHEEHWLCEDCVYNSRMEI